MDLLRIGWEEAAEYCEQLAGKIDYRPDIIIGISRGGLVPARILSDVMGINKVGIIGMVFYKKAGEPGERPQITQELAMDIKGKRVLLVDDIADTGKSLVAAKGYLSGKGPSEIKVATIHYKPKSELRPDYYVGETTAWVVYPWERHEMERELKK